MHIYDTPVPPPPCGFEFLRAKPSGDPRWWRYLCPACCAATAAVIWEEGKWRLAAEIGCSQGCAAPEMLWYQSWRPGEPPPRLPASEQGKRYARAAICRVMERVPARCTPADLRAASELAGRWVEAAELDPAPVAAALIGAATRAGLDGAMMAQSLGQALSRGRAKPASLPS